MSLEAQGAARPRSKAILFGIAMAIAIWPCISVWAIFGSRFDVAVVGSPNLFCLFVGISTVCICLDILLIRKSRYIVMAIASLVVTSLPLLFVLFIVAAEVSLRNF